MLAPVTSVSCSLASASGVSDGATRLRICRNCGPTLGGYNVRLPLQAKGRPALEILELRLHRQRFSISRQHEGNESPLGGAPRGSRARPSPARRAAERDNHLVRSLRTLLSGTRSIPALCRRYGRAT